MDFDPYHKWLGIAPEDQPPHHYRLLGIGLFESDPEVIDAAANRQMAYLQQRATGKYAALSQKLMNEIAAAWGGEKAGVFHLVMLFFSVPQVTHCTGTVDVFTAKRLYPEAQGRRRASLRSSGARRRTLGFVPHIALRSSRRSGATPACSETEIRGVP